MVDDNNPAQNSERQEGRPEHLSTYQGGKTIIKLVYSFLVTKVAQTVLLQYTL